MVVLLRFILLIMPCALSAQVADSVRYSIYCTGNTGIDSIPSSAIQLLAFESFDDSLSTIVLLGNVSGTEYKNSRRIQSESIIKPQYELFPAYRGHFYVVPGESEWDWRKKENNDSFKDYTNQWFKKNSIVKNRNEIVCIESPSPQKIKLRNGISLILIDSQWWMQKGIINLHRKNRKRYIENIDSLCNAGYESGELIFLASHHPLVSNGKRIHQKQPYRFLINYTPLKILTLLGLGKTLRTDLMQPRYKRFRKEIKGVLNKYPGIVFLSAHENNMQYMVNDQFHHIISGSGSETEPIDRYIYPAKFMDDLQSGFFKITIQQSGKVFLHAFGVKDRGEYYKTLMFTHPKSFK